MNYTHLKIHTGHSLSKSIITIDGLIDDLKKKNIHTITATDNNNIFNSAEMYKDGLAAGLKPIIASTINVYDSEKRKYEMTFYVKNKTGYSNLNKLMSRAWIENNKAEDSGILEEWLTPENVDGLIILSGARHGKIGQYILEDNTEGAALFAQKMKSLVGDNFFIELQRDATEHETKYMQGAVALSQDLEIASVATHPVYFLDKEDFFIHEIKTCINSQEKVYDQTRPLLYNKEMYLKSPEEMEALFSDLPQALENTNLIAQKCNFQLGLGKSYLPIFPTESGMSEADTLIKAANEGLQRRMKDFSPEEYRAKIDEYQKRLDWEISIINRMGFAGYFLIVADFIEYATKNDIYVAPGRGSGAGSLVAYSLGITGIDPIPYNLLFERFLNPERVSMPDFDIDFAPTGRYKVIQYVKDKYGHDKVAQISTFGTLAAKGAIKDVGKVLGYPYGVTDTIAKLINIPPAKAHEINLKTYLFGNDRFPADEKLLNLYNTEKDVKTILDLALKIEGLPRQVGMHAGGVLISPTPITDFTPLYKKDSQSEVVSQFDKDSVENVGLVKFDFLGTDILTIMHEAIQKANARREEGEELLDIAKIDIADEAVYSEIFAKGNTTGIFQFESSGMKSLFKQINPDKFEDLVALNALYRPGPMDIIPEWIESKNTPEDERLYPHPMLEGILKETYGYMIYQEQVMQCAQIIAGYSLGGADLLRRAMGKKKPEEMAKQRSVFIEGAAKNGIDEDKANELFDLIDKFSGYGFNKSHAAAYSLVAYQTAYLKHYYTAEYMSSCINAQTDTDEVYKFVLDAQKNKLKILVPDINKSEAHFTIESDDSLRYGLKSLKGVGENSIEIIKEIRQEKGNFTDIWDFLEKLPKSTIHKRNFVPMIQAGVFDSIYPNRAELFENVKELLDYNKKFNEKKIEEEVSILEREIPGFAETKGKKKKKGKVLERPVLKPTEPWDERVKLEFEKEAVGFYLTGDPVEYYTKQLNGFKASTSFDKMFEDFASERKNNAIICGMITEIREYKNKNGAFIKIYNDNSVVEVMVKKEFFTKHKELLKNDNFVAFNVSIFEGSNGFGDIKCSVKNVYSLEDCQKNMISKIFVASDNTQERLDKFREIANKYPGQIPVKLCVERTPGGRKDLIIEQLDVDFNSQLINDLTREFSSDFVKMHYEDKFKQPLTNNYRDNKNNRYRP